MTIVQYIRKPIPESYQACMDQIESTCKKQSIPRWVIHELPWPVEEKEDYRYQADIARIKLACENPDMFWLDCDCKIEKFWKPPVDGHPYFYNCSGQPDPCAFYVNGCSDFFKQLLDMFEKDQRLHTIGWIQCLLGSRGLNWKLIPSGIIKHKG